MKGYLVCSFCIVLSLSTSISGYGGGAPSAICENMVPGHGAEPQNGPNPFKVILSKTKVETEGIVEITLDSKSGNEQFVGFLIQVRRDGVNKKAYGEFVKKDDNAQTLACFNVENNAMTHTNAEPKKRVTVQWIADPKTVEAGEYKIHTTFVKDKNTYWTNQIHDQTIQVVPTGQAPGDHGSHERHDHMELCSSMNLNPAIEPQESKSNPYEIHVENHASVQQNSRIWINTTSEYDTPIMRLFMQIRRPGSSEMAYGQFVKPAKGGEGMNIELLDCFGGKGNAVMFTNPKHHQSKVSDVPLQWMAPGNETGDFEVVSTLLSEEKNFWAVVGGDEVSRKITVVKKSSSQKPTSGMTSKDQSTGTSSSMPFATTVGLFFIMMFSATLY